MSTSFRARYNLEDLEWSHEMDFDFVVAFKNIIERLNAIGGSVQNLNARVETLEEERMNGMDEHLGIPLP